jgi:hypothetical protein
MIALSFSTRTTIMLDCPSVAIFDEVKSTTVRYLRMNVSSTLVVDVGELPSLPGFPIVAKIAFSACSRI